MIEQIKQHNPKKPLTAIVIRVGVLSCVQPAALKSCFDALKPMDNLLKFCNLTILETQPSAFCGHCRRRFVLTRLGQPCLCGQFDYQISGGDDLTLVEFAY